MKYFLGVNEGRTRYGKELPDGGICIIEDDRLLLAVAEERLSRVKRDGGYRVGLPEAKRLLPFAAADAGCLVSSSCCEFQGDPPRYSSVSGDELSSSCSHHLSHALGSLAWAGVERALVVVMDSGGDVLEEGDLREWWRLRREQHTVFRIKGNDVSLVTRHADRPNEMGFGEIFRALTYFLGWKGARFAGNCMALASLNRTDEPIASTLFGDETNPFAFPLLNDPRDPVGSFNRLLESRTNISVAPREAGGPFRPDHFRTAAWVQAELERYLVAMSETYAQQGEPIILSGGVAYNCVAAGRLSRRLGPGQVLLQPASGDTGQCLGNAVYGRLRATRCITRLSKPSPFVGPDHGETLPLINDQLQEIFGERCEDDWMHQLAGLLANGEVAAGVYDGRSEYGPRALGHRSIVAHAEKPQMRRLLNRLKNRNYLMPVAPVARIEDAGTFFESIEPTPLMTKTVPIRERWSDALASTAQSRSGARLQTVDAEQRIWNLLTRLQELGRIPVILNTSMNGRGEPIVEAHDDLLEWVRNAPIDALWFNGILHSARDNKPALRSASAYSERPSNDDDLLDLCVRLKVLFPDLEQKVRDRFLLLDEYISWMREGRKSTTVRYNRNALDVPSSLRIPLYPTHDFGRSESVISETPIAHTEIVGLTYKCFGDLTDKDGLNDGFENRSQLLDTLASIYSPITETDIVTIYDIRISEVR